MERFFEGKRIIDIEDYNNMTANEKEKIEEIVSTGKFIKDIEIDGKQYTEIQLSDSEESFLVSIETRQSVVEKYVYERRMRELIEKVRNSKITTSEAAIEFDTYSKTRYMSRDQIEGYLDAIKNILNRSDFEKFMYVLFLNNRRDNSDIKQSKIDFQKYISYGVLHQKATDALAIVANRSGRNGLEMKSAKTVRDGIKREAREKIDEMGGISSYIANGINGSEKELIIELVLEKIATRDVSEVDGYVRILKKLKLDDTYLATLMELELISDDEIMTFYRTEWLGNKIEAAIQRLKPQDRKRLEERLEGQINEWVGFYAAIIALEETEDDQFKSNIDNLPPRIKKRVLDRIVEVKREIEQNKRGKTEEEPSQKEEISVDNLLKKIITTEGQEQEKYIKLFKEREIRTEELVDLINTNAISYEDVSKLYEVKALSRIIARAVAKLSLKSAIRVFMTSGNIYILNSFDWSQVDAGRLRTIRIQENEISAPIIAKIIVRMHQLRNITMSNLEISSIFAYDDINDSLRAYFELAKNGLYHEDSIIALWNEKVHESNSENPYEQQASEDVTVEELLGFFNPDKVIAKMEGYCNPNLPDEESKKENEGKIEDLTYDVGVNEFLTFYRGILEGNRIKDEEKTEQIIAELESKLAEKMIEGMAKRDATYLLAAVQLLEKKVISTDNMQGILSDENQEKLIEMYGEEIDDITLLSLYRHGLVQDDILELIYQDFDGEQIQQRIESITAENIIILCALGVLNVKQLGNSKFEDIDWKSISTHIDEETLKNIIEQLYLNGNIGYEEIRQLKEDGYLCAKEAEAILDQIDLKSILRKGLTSEEGEGEKGRKKIKQGRTTQGTKLADREVLLKDLGFEPITDENGQELVVADGSFKGFKVYMDNTGKFKVIVLEKDKKASTFIMHRAKAGEFFQEEEETTKLVGSRSDWREKSRTDGSVIAKLHTVNWGRNIIKTIVDVDSIFRFDDEEQRIKYVREESERLCEVNKLSIDFFRMEKEDAKATGN